MKTIAGVLFLTIGCLFQGYGQCTANAGNDIHFCQNWESQGWPELELGAQPTVEEGLHPFTYEWSIEPIALILGGYLYASSFLDDTTAANPLLTDFWADSMTFYLRVEDADQQVCYDTVLVTTSLFNTHLGSVSYTITAGDSVELFFGPNIASNYPTDSLVWRPNIGLTDSTALFPWAAPNVSVGYYCKVWDIRGCSQVGSPFQYVNVLPVSVEEKNSVAAVKVYSTEMGIVLILDRPFAPYTFELWDSQGRSVLRQQIWNPTTRISTTDLGKGIYIYSLGSNNAPAKNGKLLIN